MTVMNQSIFIKLPFQMLGLPMDSETYGQMCASIASQYPPGTERSVGEAIVGDELARQKAEDKQKGVAITPPAETPVVPPAATPAVTPAKSPGSIPSETTVTAEITPIRASAVATPAVATPAVATPAKSPDTVSAVATPAGTLAKKSETPAQPVSRALNFSQTTGGTRRVLRSAKRKTRRTKKA